MKLPQLRIRTEFSYRKNYGPLNRLADRLTNIGCPAAAIVDETGTWGHVDWEKQLTEAGISPIFGTEFKIECADGFKRVCWILADDLPSFYRISSNPPKTEADMIGLTGVVRFAGAALTDPAAFDYIDINPRSRMRTAAALKLAKETGKPLVITSDNDYPSLEDRDRFLAWDASEKMTPQHILDDSEVLKAFPTVPVEILSEAIVNTIGIGERLAGRKLAQAPIINVEGDLMSLIQAGKKHRLERGHIPEWTDEYEARMIREYELILLKEYESYFIVVADMIIWAKERMLVGPARGSSAGSLVCYLMQITEVDPLVHHLIFERFIDLNRSDLPDIDIDFNDKKRYLVFEYLAEKYGQDNVARIGSINRLKPRSVVAHVTKKLGIPHGAAFPVLNVIEDHSSGSSLYGKGLEEAMTNTTPGKDFMTRYPEAYLMGQLELHASHSGVHAAGIIVANVPVVEYCTVRDGIAQIDKKAAEYLNLLKIDALGLRTLGVIEDSGCMTARDLYDLKLDDPEVLGIFNDKKFSGVFQFEGAAQRSVSVHVPIDSFEKIDHVTALARPGPLGGGSTQKYIARNAGREEVTYRHPTMEKYLGDTMGLVLYQEQVMRISFEIGKFPWEIVSDIRKAMSGSKGEEYFNKHGETFIKGAATLDIPEAEALEIWNEIVSFGAWGMNKSHTVSYATISYWCAYMKRYHGLEYAAACLRNAKDDVQAVEQLRELVAEGIGYTAFDPQLSGTNWEAREGKVIGGFSNLVGIGPVKAKYWVDRREEKGLTEADLKKIAKCPPKHADLSPAHTLWGDMYADPSSCNINGEIQELGKIGDEYNGKSVVIIGQLIEVKRRDQNEAVLVNKRNGKLYRGQSQFLDMFMVDDSVAKPMRVRISTREWYNYGLAAADKAVAKKDWFLVRGKWLGNFNMMTITKLKCLTNKELFL